MNGAIIKKVLDTVRPNRSAPMYAVRNDINSRTIQAVVAVDGRPFSVPSDTSAAISFRRRDGEGKAFAGTVNADGTVSAVIPQWALELEGDVTYSIKLVGDTFSLSTTHSVIHVQFAPSDGEISPDDADYDSYTALLSEMSDLRSDVENLMLFTAYSEYADGTDFSEEWQSGMIYTGYAWGRMAPADKNGYKWSRNTLVSVSSVEQTTVSDTDGGVNVATVTLTDGTQSALRIKNGSKGDKGEKGDAGEGVDTLFETKYSSNLLDISNITNDKYCYNGSLYSNVSYVTTDYIPCSFEDTLRLQYDMNGIRYDCEQKQSYGIISFAEAYDKDKNYIVNSTVRDITSYTCPDSTSYVRISILSSIINGSGGHSNIAVVNSDTAFPLPYEEYSERLVLRSENNNEEYITTVVDSMVKIEVDAYLPKNIYCAVGRTIELYNSQVCLQANKYHFQWSCKIGKAMKRKFVISGISSLIGEYSLSLNIYNDKLDTVWSGKTVLHIVSDVMSTSKSICPIGDSLTNDKSWAYEIMRLSNGKISFLGTYQGAYKDSEGVWQYWHHEGRSGFSAKSYLTETVYSYGGESEPHAFWNGERFDWNYYKQSKNISADAVQLFLGTNGIAYDNTENAENIKKIVDYIRQDDANIPIFVVNTIYRGSQDGIGTQQSNEGYTAQFGVFKYGEDKKIMDLMKRLDTLLNEYDGVYMVNLAITHDSEYNFGEIEMTVNPRAVQTERLPVESVHPQEQGYFQMADVMYSVYCAVFG